MRFFFSFVIFLSFTADFYSQIPNNGFEQWSNGDPVGWSTTNSLGFTTVSQSSEAHGGSSAAKGEVVSTTFGNIYPYLISGPLGGHGFPISERYASLTGYYKLNVITNENLSVVIGIYKNGQVIGVGGSQFFGAATYTKFSAPIYYTNGETPDSCQISITIGNNTGDINLGTYFLIDDLAFEGIATDVNDEANYNPENFSLAQNYPNPFNPSTKINFSIPQGTSRENVSLKVFDMLGNEVATLVNEKKSAGNYEIKFDASGLSSGIYLYTLQSGGFVETKKMIYLK